jgi:hypothetical protein
MHFEGASCSGLQGAGHELGHLAIFQSGVFGTEIKTFCVLFFLNERTFGLRAALRGILNLSMVFSEAHDA